MFITNFIISEDINSNHKILIFFRKIKNKLFFRKNWQK